ncbi:MAG: DUF1801 domain-containing protein [Bacteroidota bacterium]
MAENKTRPTRSSVIAFLNKIKDKQLRDDCSAILEMMEEVSQSEPVMWGSAIVGFGTYHYVYESGREGDMPIISYSPRKRNISVYLLGGLKNIKGELSKLGKYEAGKGCPSIKSLSDVKVGILRKIFAKALKEAQRRQRQSAS